MFQTALEQMENGAEALERVTVKQKELRERLFSAIHILESMEGFSEMALYLKNRLKDLEGQEDAVEQLALLLIRVRQEYRDCESRIVDYLEDGGRMGQKDSFEMLRTADVGEWGQLIQFWEE